MNQIVKELEEQKNKIENDLKTSVDKIYDLREIIAELETQVAAKTLNENVLHNKCIELERYIENQNVAHESLKDELNKISSEINATGSTDINTNFEHVSTEPNTILEQMVSQLKTVELLLDRKTKTLEAFHALTAVCSTTCSSPSEDVSKSIDFDGNEQSPMRTKRISLDGGSPYFDAIQKILDKLTKHNRIEEATVKKITDLEMHSNIMRGNLIVSIYTFSILFLKNLIDKLKILKIIQKYQIF